MAKCYPYKNNGTPVTPTACSIRGRSQALQPPLHAGESYRAAERFEQGIVWMGTNIYFSLTKGRGTLEQTQTWGSNMTDAFGRRQDSLDGGLLLKGLLPRTSQKTSNSGLCGDKVLTYDLKKLMSI